MNYDKSASQRETLEQQIAELQQRVLAERTDLHGVQDALRTRVRQQQVVAELGQQALLGTPLSDLFTETVTRLAETLGVEYCEVLELLPEGKALLLRAGVGWHDGLVGQGTVSADVDSQAGYTLLVGEPVIVHDLREETRFSGPALLHEHGVVSGVSVVIHGHQQPFGVLGVYTTKRSTFTNDDVHFLQSVANLLAMAIERWQREEALRQSRDQLEIILHGIKEGITVQAPDGNLIYANAAAAQLIGYDSVEALLQTPVNEVMKNFEVMDEAGRPIPVDSLPGRLALQGQQPEEQLLRFRLKEGNEERWSIVNARPVFDDHGQVQFAVNIFRDVTERTRLYELERLARAQAEMAGQQLQFLAETSAILATSLDYEETLARIAQLAVPEIADACAVDILVQTPVAEAKDPQSMIGEAGTFARMAVAHLDPVKVELIYQLQRDYPPEPELPGGLPHVLRTGQSWLYPDITDELLVAFAQNDEHLDILRRLQICSVMIVPLKARERILGALTLLAAESKRRFGPDDLALAEELASRAALAVDNARLYQEASRLNQELEDRVAARTVELQESNTRLEAEIAVRRQAEERIRLQAARTVSLVRTAARLNARLDLEAVLQAVCEETAKALDIPMVTVSLYDPDQKALVPAYSHGMPANFEATAEPLPRHLYEEYTRQMGHLVVIDDIQALADLPNIALYRDLDIRTTVSVSMVREDRLIGRLNVGSVGHIRHFSSNELALLQGLADQAAQAIANAGELEARRRTEETLRKSQMQLAEAQKISHLGSWEWDIVNDVVTWSDETYRIFGFSPGAFPVTYEKFLELVHPEDRQFTHQMIQEAYKTEQPYNFYHRIMRPDGTVRINQARGRVVSDETGKIVALVGTGQDVTELKQAEAQLERQTKQLAAVGEMGLAVTASLDLEVVLKRVLEQVSPLLPAESIFLLLREGDELLFAASSGPGASGLEGHRVPATAGVAGQVLKSGRAVWIEDVEQERIAGGQDGTHQKQQGRSLASTLLLHRGDEGYRVRSLLVVPLLLHGQVAGVIEAAHSRTEAFSAEDLQLLAAAASWAAIAIANARLYQAERQAHQVADILRAANLALSERLDLDSILETLLDHVDQLVAYDTANVMLRDGNYLTMHALRGYDKWAEPDAAQKVVFDIRAVPHLHNLVTQQRGIIIPDTTTHPGWQPRQGIVHVRSWLGVPLVARGKVIGLFSLDKAEPDAFSQSDLHLVETLAAQATIAIENARLFEQVRAGQERLRQLTKQVVSAQEEERQRVSRELHDEAGQALTALKISLDLTRSSLPPELEVTRSNIGEAMALTDETMDRIRLLAQNLRPPALDTLGLSVTLEGLCHDFAQRTKLSISYRGSELPPLPDAVNISLYRFVQEALTNVAKHARADRVSVVLAQEKGQVSVTVSDNGQGFQVEEQATETLHTSGIGLVGMRERFELLGGRLEIESRPGEGTRLVACAPVGEG